MTAVIDFSVLARSDQECPRCGADAIEHTDLVFVPRPEPRWPVFARNAGCSGCGLAWVEVLKTSDAYAIDTRDKRLKNSGNLNLDVNNPEAA